MIGKVFLKTGKEIRLTAERWSHIVESHDYMAGNQDLVFETIEDPDIMVSPGDNEFIAIKHYAKTSISEKHVVIIYKEDEKEGFVITAFMTSKAEKIFKKGSVWKK
jgi:hypothetical protein